MVKAKKPAAIVHIDPDTATLQSFSVKYHEVMAVLHAQGMVINAQMSAINSNAPSGLTQEQNNQLDELAAVRKKINNAVRQYSMIHNMVINNSAEIRNLASVVANVNGSLRDALNHLNHVVQVIDDINAVIATLNSFLVALTAIARL